MKAPIRIHDYSDPRENKLDPVVFKRTIENCRKHGGVAARNQEDLLVMAFKRLFPNAGEP